VDAAAPGTGVAGPWLYAGRPGEHRACPVTTEHGLTSSMQTRDPALVRRFAGAYRNPALAVLEGFHPATHALRFGASLEIAVTYDRRKLLTIADRLAPDTVAPIENVLHVVEPRLFDSLSPRSLSSPLLSIAPRPVRDIAHAVRRTGKPVVLLDRPRNPGNVGAAIRVAAAADVEAVLVSGHVDPWSPVVIRSATGLQFAVTVGSVDLPLATDRPIVTVDAGGEPLHPPDLDVDSILVVGGERYGISPAIREVAQRSVAVPMRPGVSSLNLSTALAAVLYAWTSSVTERTGSPAW